MISLTFFNIIAVVPSSKHHAEQSWNKHPFNVKIYQMDLKEKCRDPIIVSNAYENGPRNGILENLLGA